MIKVTLKDGSVKELESACSVFDVAKEISPRLAKAACVAKIDGEIKTCEGEKKTHYVAELGEKRPFRCYLDVGLRRTTTGARLFAALKGCNDGGLDIPHKNTRFYGYSREEKSYDAGAPRQDLRQADR